MNFRKSRLRSRVNSVNVMANSGKWKQYGKRTSRGSTDTESDGEEPQYHELKDWVETFFERKSESKVNYDQDIDVQLTKKQTLILSTLVPDEILMMDKFDAETPTRFVGVLLMADVSGYTALSERYNNTGQGGTCRLTATLNSYLGSLAELIYGHGGDILKFAGDAFLALWKTDKRTFLCHTIHTVIECALLIQRSFGSYETDVKVNLRVKLAISAGNIFFSPIGSGIDMNYVIFGLPVLEAKTAESVCASGEVILSPSAWGHCYSRNYDHIVRDDGHVAIKTILYDPREKDVTKPFVGLGSMMRQIKNTFDGIENLPDFFWDLSVPLSAANHQKKHEALNLRKSIILAEEKPMLGSQIRRFMIRPVLTQVDAHQPLEYLTEMRQASILFLTLKPKECSFRQLITIVNNSYKITCKIVYRAMGCVNKIILFDKDIMILVIFGLRGYKHESEAQAALKCGYSIRKSVSALDGVVEASVGVTTGQVYCGVVGHPLRREFTVIGAIVNKAARLMCAFRNKVSCDEATYINSKMSSNGFTLQSNVKLKGIVSPGKLYEYTEEIREKVIHNIPVTPPLLDRNDEFEYFRAWIMDSKSSKRSFDALLLSGEARVGKTRMLEWMCRYAKNQGFKVCYITLSSIHSATAYLTLSQITNHLLDLTEPITGFSKEEKVIELLKVYDEDLCYLNDVIKVRFAFHEKIYTQDVNTRKEKAKLLFQKLALAVHDVHIIFLDDLQNLDSSTWEFLPLIFEAPNVFTVFSATRGKTNTGHSWLYDGLVHDSIRKMSLGPLASSWMPPLACQVLDVTAVPMDLCNALMLKCNGMPGLVENFLIHLYSSGALEIKKIRYDDIENWKEEDLQFPESQLLHPQAIDSKNQQALDQLIENDAIDEIPICIITLKDQLKTSTDIQNMDVIIMILIDTLTPYQQLLLKIASVIGNVLSRELLENIMYENNSLTTARAVKRLFAMRILSCANARNKWSSCSSAISIASYESCQRETLCCDCPFDYDPESNENLPKYAFCKIMKFWNKNSRKTCYELLPMNQKKEFHTRIVNYLENTVQKCQSCGGKMMIVETSDNFETCIRYSKSSIDSEIKYDENQETILDSVNLETGSFSRNEINNGRKSISVQNSSNIMGTRKTVSDINVYNASTPSQSNQFTSILKEKVEGATAVPRSSAKRVTMPDLYFKKMSSLEISGNKIFEMLRFVVEAKDVNDWQNLGIVDSKHDSNVDKSKNKNKQSFCIQIEKGVSKTNFYKCTCADLNITLCEQLIHHARQAELIIKVIEFLIHFSYLNVLNSTVEKTLSDLHEAQSICMDKELQENTQSQLSKFDKRRFLARIHSLKAAVFYFTDRLELAKSEIERAFRIYNINIYKVDIIGISKLIRKIKLKRRQYRIHDLALKADSVFCLNIATLVYSSLGEDKASRMTTYLALKYVNEAECHIIDICDAFSNAIHIEIERDMPDATAEIERMAGQVLGQVSKPMQAHELCAAGKLFMSTFCARLARGELASAIRAGFRSITISHFVLADHVTINIIPDLFYALLAQCYIREAVDILQLTIRMGKKHASHDCETWYYALCMDMILDAGFQLESPQEINRFAEYSLVKGMSEGPSRRRLVVNLWLYWLRANANKKARRFETEALEWMTCDEEDASFVTYFSSLRLAEGMLESLSRKIDDLKKMVDLMELRSIADKLLTKLEKPARLCRAIYPRWLLLKSITLRLSGRRGAANSTFNLALEEARRNQNRLEENLMLATISDPTIWLKSARAGTFLRWEEGAKQAHSAWYLLLYKMTTNNRR